MATTHHRRPGVVVDSAPIRLSLLNGFERHRTNGSILPLDGEALHYMHKFATNGVHTK